MHIPTLVVTAALVSAVVALLLIWTWSRDRKEHALLWWGVSGLFTASGVALVSQRAALPDFVTIELANALLLFGGGLVLKGARLFGGRIVAIWQLLIPPCAWIALCQFEFLSTDVRLRIAVASVVLAAYCYAAAFEFWRGREEMLVSRHAVQWTLVTLGTGLLMRIPTAYILPAPSNEGLVETPQFGVVAIGFVLFMVTFSFILLSIAKERTEAKHKQAALVDPLTGLLNRRAFYEAGADHVARATAARPCALVVFDLDRFKQINDTFGHPVGDRVLQLFAECAAAELRLSDLVGRLGGEEFAALLPDCDAVVAVEAAERVRLRFARAARHVDIRQIDATVSAGVAISAGSPTLPVLLTEADHALYRAKAAGRNCVRLVSPDDIAASVVDLSKARVLSGERPIAA